MEFPLISFVLISYNQEAYIREALAGALLQGYPNLEIVVSDDCSEDDTFKIIKDVVSSYIGPHRITCSRNPVNLGIAGHINKVNSLANGELIIIAAGDDISFPNRVTKIADAYLACNRTVHYFYSSAIEMDLDGVDREIVTSPGASNAGNRFRAGLSGYPLAVGATQAWSRLMINSFSPLGKRVWAEDQIFGFRGLLLGKVVYIDEPLVRYRIGSGISTKNIKFSMRKFFKNQMKTIWILAQRSNDAFHIKKFGLSGIIASKALLIFVSLPISPFFAALRKIVRI